jgi:hypothetical protein
LRAKEYNAKQAKNAILKSMYCLFQIDSNYLLNQILEISQFSKEMIAIKPKNRLNHKKDKLMAKIKPQIINSVSVINSKADDIWIKSQKNEPEKGLIANQINTNSTISSSPIFTQSLPSTLSTTSIIIEALDLQTNNPTVGQRFLLNQTSPRYWSSLKTARKRTSYPLKTTQ